MPTEDKFAEWYAVPVPNFTPEQISSRLKAVVAIAQDISTKDLPLLVRTFYSMQTNDIFSESLRKRIREQDERYVSRDTAELAIIAGAVIFDLTSSTSDIGDAAALSIKCFEAAGLRNTSRLQDVVDQSQQYLVEQSVKVREEAPDPPQFPIQALGTSISKLKENQADLPQYSAAVANLLVRVVKAMDDYAKGVTRQIAYFERRRREESNILYWMFSKASIQGKTDYTALPVKEAAILAAVELSELTENLPGPSRARAFLQYIIEKSQGDASAKATIPDCVNAIDESRRPTLASLYTTNDPCLNPILYAISKSHESGGGNDWTAAFKTQSQLDPKKKLNIVDISELLYSELLAKRALI